MEEGNKKDILWWQHFFNFLFCIAVGYVLIIMLATYLGFVFLGVELIIFMSYSKHNRKQDMLMQALVIIVGLLIGYSLCVSYSPNILYPPT